MKTPLHGTLGGTSPQLLVLPASSDSTCSLALSDAGRAGHCGGGPPVDPPCFGCSRLSHALFRRAALMQVLFAFAMGFILKAVGPALVMQLMFELQSKRLGTDRSESMLAVS